MMWLIQVDISKVVTLCKLLESLLLVSKNVDLKSDAQKLNPIICSTFVFCYLWAIGGNITDAYWDAFDSFVRRQFEDNNDAKVSSLSLCLPLFTLPYVTWRLARFFCLSILRHCRVKMLVTVASVCEKWLQS